MQCLVIQELLSPYLDGVLTQSEQEEISAHLAVCPNCRAEFEILCEMVSILKSLPELSPAPGFSKQVLKNVSTLPSAAGKVRPMGVIGRLARGPWSRVVALAAALVFTAGMTVLMYGMPGQQEKGKQISQTLVDQGQTNQEEISGRDRDQAGVQQNDNSSAGSGPESRHFTGITGAPDVSAQGGEARTAAGNGILPHAPGLEYSNSPGGQNTYVEPLNRPTGNQENSFIDLPAGSTISRVMAVKEGIISRKVAYGNIPASSQESDQKIIHTVTLHLDIDQDVQSEIEDFARSNGVQLAGYSGEGALLMKVPAGQYETVVNSIQDLGKLTLGKMNSEDVSKEYTAYEARLKELALNEQFLLEAIEKSGTTPSPEAETQLKEVREDLEYQKKQLIALSSQVEYSTIELNFK